MSMVEGNSYSIGQALEFLNDEHLVQLIYIQLHIREEAASVSE